jgi:hypothetical protein
MKNMTSSDLIDSTTAGASRPRVLNHVLLIATFAILTIANSHVAQAGITPRVLPVNSSPYGNSYAEWSAKWFQWAFSLPVADHPFTDSPNINFSAGQSGPVWFLAGTFGTTERALTLPAGKAIFATMINVECSSLEPEPFYGATAAAQAAGAKAFADLMVNVFCELDGVPVTNIQDYRVVSPQYTFTAPTPWIFAADGGTGTSVGDGYFVMISPLSKGLHTLHLGGTFHFPAEEGGDLSLDTTYHITVQ